MARPAPPPPGFQAPNPPAGIPVHFLTTPKTAGKVELTCTNSAGKRVGLYLGKEAPGLDWCVFDVKEPGEYTVTLKSGDMTQTRKVTVKQIDAGKVDKKLLAKDFGSP